MASGRDDDFEPMIDWTHGGDGLCYNAFGDQANTGPRVLPGYQFTWHGDHPAFMVIEGMPGGDIATPENAKMLDGSPLPETGLKCGTCGADMLYLIWP